MAFIKLTLKNKDDRPVHIKVSTIEAVEEVEGYNIITTTSNRQWVVCETIGEIRDKLDEAGTLLASRLSESLKGPNEPG